MTKEGRKGHGAQGAFLPLFFFLKSYNCLGPKMNIIQARFIIVYSLFFLFFSFFFKQKLKLFSGSLEALWVCAPDKVIGPERKALPLRKHPSTSQGTPWPPGLQPTPERTAWALPIYPGPSTAWGPTSFPCTIISVVKARQTVPLQTAFMCCLMCRHPGLASGPQELPVTPHWGTGHLHPLTHHSLSSGGSSVFLMLGFQPSCRGSCGSGRA